MKIILVEFDKKERNTCLDIKGVLPQARSLLQWWWVLKTHPTE
jgi:hypothetical protein